MILKNKKVAKILAGRKKKFIFWNTKNQKFYLTGID